MNIETVESSDNVYVNVRTRNIFYSISYLFGHAFLFLFEKNFFFVNCVFFFVYRVTAVTVFIVNKKSFLFFYFFKQTARFESNNVCHIASVFFFFSIFFTCNETTNYYCNIFTRLSYERS